MLYIFLQLKKINLQTLPDIFWEAKLSLVENHWPGKSH